MTKPPTTQMHIVPVSHAGRLAPHHVTHARIPDRSPLELFIGGRNIADRTKARLMALNLPSPAPLFPIRHRRPLPV